MKRSIKTALCTGVAAIFLYTSGSYVVDYSKKWVDSKVNDAIVQYEKGDKQWTDKALKEGMDKYKTEDQESTEKSLKEGIDKYRTEDQKNTEQSLEKGILNYEQKDKAWTKQNFEEKINFAQLTKAYESTYKILRHSYFKTSGGELVDTVVGSGSGILLNGGYFLTAHHVTDIEVGDLSHPAYGIVKYSHSGFILTKDGETSFEEIELKDNLEKIVTGSEEIDYTLLKLKDDAGFAFYEHGLNVPSKVELGMKSVAIGYPSAAGRNLRLGNVSQIKSDVGENYFTFKNSVIPGDSGGPLFIMEDGKLNLVALSRSILIINLGQADFPIPQIANVNHGLKVESIIKDMESKLESGQLDEKTAKEVQNFLKLNKK